MKTYMFLALICLSLLTPSLFAQTPAPIPEEARKHFVMGTTLFKDAKTADDYSRVVNEFKQAADLAAQWPDARYNLGLAKEAAGDYSGAMAELKLYLQFKLSDTEARTVQDKIYALEAKAGAAAKKKEAEEQATAAAKARAQMMETFRGAKWTTAECRGCTSEESGGGHWDVLGVVVFNLQNDGSVKLNGMSVLSGCDGDVFGVPEGESFTDIRWEIRPKDGPPRKIWNIFRTNGAGIAGLRISCDRAASEGATLSSTKYRYVGWGRLP